MTDSRLTSESRDRALARLVASSTPGEELDILVIGGGVTGAGIALDAVSRGLSTAVVEAQDWASGTSSRSSKLMHGGLRYLQMLDFKLVLEALKERDLLLTEIAPHLVRPVPFLYPLRRRVFERIFVGAGILLYDLLATIRTGKRALPFHRHLSRAALTETFPDFAQTAAVGAVEYWDANVDDARFVLTVMRTAVERGAHAASRTQVVELTRNAAGAVDGAILMDLETGVTFPVKAKSVISSTGVWTEESQSLADKDGGLRVLASKGIHIVVPRDRIDGNAGLILQTSKSVLFVIPWSRYWAIGTTDTPWTEDLMNPVATAADIDYVIAEANKVLARPISHDDIVGTWAGLRPLLQPGTKSGTQSAKVSREHTVASTVAGFVSIAGGKFTTYRVMAKDAVDFAIGSDAKRLKSVTRHIPLVGAEGFLAAKSELKSIITGLGWSAAMTDHLFHRYGANIRDIAEIALRDPDLATPLEHAPAYLRAELVYAMTHEGALHLDDLMMRRTRMVYEYLNEGMDALPEVAELARVTLGWSDEQAARETELYRLRAAADADAATQPDDASASRARAAAVEIVPMVDLGATAHH
ncbi:glycerol-3-phosphate dehydrogenase/oxidase [Salinibacterium sp. G-O1]|uniref:glycerol-3-phosphate dehydrogenase/oxidase n=1 Tax=Salinibacterium sp. G-O1 TaxID=3046208 RepID=UPI0024B8FA6F|nr:glycerol-3-phosphate dehydrogenase/oxidase [Salinibacterium sp. G-O1]MDJ0336161.1 glycerol-3-phosphate dehydrogenase/oxidase [Salinibacterium sp. G-O1]